MDRDGIEDNKDEVKVKVRDRAREEKRGVEEKRGEEKRREGC